MPTLLGELLGVLAIAALIAALIGGLLVLDAIRGRRPDHDQALDQLAAGLAATDREAHRGR